jgi:predicted nucleic acid-binding protein
MGLNNYFWDSYAVIELIRGNSLYALYSDEPIKLSIFNLVEIYWFALNEYGEEKANKLYDSLKNCLVKMDDVVLKEAVKFRKKVYKDKKISYADAIGYTYAIKNNLVFLTGDKEFKELANVKFIQKE